MRTGGDRAGAGYLIASAAAPGSDQRLYTSQDRRCRVAAQKALAARRPGDGTGQFDTLGVTCQPGKPESTGDQVR